MRSCIVSGLLWPFKPLIRVVFYESFYTGLSSCHCTVMPTENFVLVPWKLKIQAITPNTKWMVQICNPRPYTKIFSCIVYGFAVFRARVGRNNIFCISRDAVLTNQQLPTRYSSGVAKRLARNVWGKLDGNVWAESFKSRLCWFFIKFCAPWVALFLQLAG